MSKEQFSFEVGWSQLRMCDAPECTKRIMDALGIKTLASFRLRRRGEIEPKLSEVKAIEDVFKDYGIKKVWGKNT